jgi:hypothetical protein
MKLRHALCPILLLAVLAVSACGGGSPAGENPADTDLADLTNLGTAVPPCPFTVEKVSEVIGQSMTDDGDCLFGDGKGVASLTVTMASELAGSATYDYQRKQAGERFERVTDAKKGDKGYLGVKGIEGEAVVLSEKGAYTLTPTSFSKDSAWYEQTLHKLLETVPV